MDAKILGKALKNALGSKQVRVPLAVAWLKAVGAQIAENRLSPEHAWTHDTTYYEP